MRKIFTPRFLFVGFFFFLLAANGFAQQNSGSLQKVGPTVAITGNLIRVTPKLADIDKTTMYGEPLKITRDMNGIIVDGSGDFARNKRETKRKLEEEMRERIAKEYNEAIKNNKTEVPQVPGPITPNVPGTSLGVNINGQTSPGLQPSDNNMAAGPNHLIQIVNNTSGSQFTIYSKAGAVLGGPTILATLTGRSGSGDPIVLYDQLADRWFMAEFGPSACCSELIIAVSATSSPLGAWNVYSYIDATFFPDYPKFSVWHNAYYAYTRDFGPGGSGFLGSSVWAFDRTAMLAGAPTAQMVRQRLTGANISAIGSVGLEGMTPSTLGGHFIIPTGATTLNIFEVTQNFGASTITVGPLVPLTVNAWNAAGTIPQQTGPSLGSLSPFLMFKLNYRNNGGTESIVLCQTVAGSGAAGQVRWYELRRVAGNWTVFQQGNVQGTDGNSRWMPGISMDGCGNIALMYNVAGAGAPAAHPSVRYTGRNSFDPLNTMTLPEAVIFNGTVGTGGITRWGDYNTTVQDYTSAGNPNNGSFWSTAQHSNQQTRIANFTLTGGCAAAPNITAGTATLTAEGCVPNNAVIDPGETVTVSFCALNTGTSNTVNLVGTMQVSGGVTPISGPQNYGVLVFGGAAVCRSFSFSNTSGTCGGTITVSIQWQDGAANLGTSTWTFTLGTTVVSSSENFDAVVAPALPAGWVATNVSGPAPLWVTSSTGSLLPVPSLPNSLFIDDPGSISDKQIVTPSFTPGAGARVSFSKNYILESTFDGGVLEISINGAPYQDIITAGGSFVAGGYTGVISAAFGNPLANRNAWTGTSGGFTTTTVNLPAGAAGQPCQLKFRMGSDNSVAGTGWRVDNFSVSQPACCGAACTITCPANITTTTGPGATSCGIIVNYPAATTTGLCGAVTYSRNSGTFFPVGITTVTATTAAGPSCTFTVTVTDNTPPVTTCPGNISVNNAPGTCAATVNYPSPTVTDNCGLPGPVGLTQTASQVPTAGSVACNAGGFHTLNSYWRAYNLAPLALPGPLTVNSVQFGIELSDANGTGTTQPVTVNVYTSAGAFPGGVRTLVGTSGVVQVPDQTLTTLTVPITVPPVVPANAILCVELVTPDGRAPANNRFFIGSNASAQTGPSYIQAADCGIAVPTDLTTIGFPNMHIILNINGATGGAAPLVQIAGLPSGSVFPVGVTTNTFRGTDIAGNTSTCSFTVTVVDNQAPVITCPANISLPTPIGSCTVVVPYTVTSSDNCPGVTQALTAGLASGSAFPIGVNTVSWRATDASGNISNCSFTVTVTDGQLPVITGQPTNQTVCVGTTAVFSVTATNVVSYQWQTWTGPSGTPANTWVNIAGANASALTLPAVTFSMNTNDYRVVINGLCTFNIISNFATLYVNPLPTITLLASRTLALLPGNSLNITAVVNPGGGTYQWFKNGVAFATGSSLNGLTVDDIGSYTCRYTDLNGCVATSAAMVVTGQPSDKLWLYPNPNRGSFQVRFFNTTNEPVTLNIYNSIGQKVYSRALVTAGIAYSQIDVDMSNLSSGEYNAIIVRADGKVVGTRKFSKLN